VFFFWPATQAVWYSFQLQDAFGLKSQFVGLQNFAALFRDGNYLESFKVTALFSVLVAFLRHRHLAAVRRHGRPRACAARSPTRRCSSGRTPWRPPVAGVLWAFSLRARRSASSPYLLKRFGIDWNWIINADQAMALVVIAGRLEADLVQLPLLPRRAAVDPRSLIEAAAIDGASPSRRFWTSSFRCSRRPPSFCW